MDGMHKSPQTVDLVDPKALWATLSPTIQQDIGTAAITLMIGLMGIEGETKPDGFRAASHAALNALAAFATSELGSAFTTDGTIRLPDLGKIGIPACRACGCTDLDGCEDGCAWVEENLCSTCSATIF